MEIIRSQEFVLPTTKNCKALGQWQHEIPNEETTLNELLSWVHHDLEKKQISVNFWLMLGSLFLYCSSWQTGKNNFFRDDIECQKLIMEAMKYHILPERWPMLQVPWTKPRKSTISTLFVIGGMDSTKRTSIENYGLYTNMDSCSKYEWEKAVLDDKLRLEEETDWRHWTLLRVQPQNKNVEYEASRVHTQACPWCSCIRRSHICSRRAWRLEIFEYRLTSKVLMPLCPPPGAWWMWLY